MPSFLLLGEQAREMLRMPENWHAYAFTVVRQGGENAPMSSPILHYEVTGICCPMVKRGSKKGNPNYHAGSKSTRLTAFITPAQADEWCKQWEIRTGNCIQCDGTGKAFRSWHHLTGTEYKPCSACGATGKPKSATLAARDGKEGN